LRKKILMKIMTKDYIAFDTETTDSNAHKAKLLGYSVAQENRSFFSSTAPTGSLIWESSIVAHNGKYDAIVVSKNCGFTPEIHYDTMLAYYLLHIDRPRKLETIVKDVFGVDKKDLQEVYNEATGETRKSLPSDWYLKVPEAMLAHYAEEDVRWTYKLKEYCDEKFEKNPVLKDWFFNIEMPLLNILVQSELQGVKLDVEELKRLGEIFSRKKSELGAKLRRISGCPELNLNSSKQLQEVLYKKFKLKASRKTKTGFSTDTDALKKLDHHAFPKLLLEYKELEKLLNSFVEPLLELAQEDGRIHCTFNQALTRTRRFSCSDPNLQQIPSRSKLGQLIRGCFVASEGYKFLIADYSQMEPRLLAHFSDDPLLIEWFRNGDDIYLKTSEFMSKKLGKEFTRSQAKILQLSITYGKTSYGFAQDWGCTRQEAEQILNTYFQQFKRVKDYIQEQQDECKANNGWVYSIAGLPLYVEGINSNDKWKYEEAMRQAVNYRIQASSQDILKSAIVNIYNKLNAYPLLYVHDELVFEMTDLDPALIVDEMKSAWKLAVPLEVEFKISERWVK